MTGLLPQAKLQRPGTAAIAGRRKLAMLRAEKYAMEQSPELLAAAARMLSECGLHVFHLACGVGQMTALVQAPDGADALHAAGERLRQAIGAEKIKIRENLSVLAALHRSPEATSRLISAIQGAGVPIHHMAERAPCLLMAVNDSQYETALRAAYRAR